MDTKGVARMASWPRVSLIAVPFIIIVLARDLTYGWLDTSLSGVLACLLLVVMIVNQSQWQLGYEAGHREAYIAGRRSVIDAIIVAGETGVTAGQWLKESMDRGASSVRHGTR